MIKPDEVQFKAMLDVTLQGLLNSGFIDAELKKYKSFHRTLLNWVKGDLERGYISYMSETERLDMSFVHPDKIAQREKLHEQAVKEGII